MIERIQKIIATLKHVQPNNYDSMVLLVACVNELTAILKENTKDE